MSGHTISGHTMSGHTMYGHTVKCMELCCYRNASNCCSGQDIVGPLWKIHVYLIESLLLCVLNIIIIDKQYTLCS